MASQDQRQAPSRVRPPEVKTERTELFIGGGFAPAASAERIALIDPATEQQFGSIVDGNAADVDRAVRVAQAALPAWRAVGPQARGAIIGRLADLFETRLGDIAALVSWQNGAVIQRSMGSNGHAPLATYRHHAELANSFAFENVVESPRSRVINIEESVGVVGAIVPWNAPQGLLAKKLAASLLAGCTVVAKPSPETSLDSFLLAELLIEAGLPAGVVNIVTGGRDTGAALVDHPGVDMISFTGSTDAGRMVAAACGRKLKEVTAELGGKSAAILLDDADLDRFAATMIENCLPNTGQACYSSTRILAPRSRWDAVVEVVTETIRAAPFGDPLDLAMSFGPLVTSKQRDRVLSYIESGKAEGATATVGGHRAAQFEAGYFVEPTVFVDVTPSMKIYREEIFGPVLVVVPYDDEAHAITMASDSAYGLAGSVYSKDIDRAVKVAREMQTGGVLVNGSGLAKGIIVQGRKDSGVGGGDVLSSYLQIKSIAIPV